MTEHTQRTIAEAQRIWLSRNLYIPVDNAGYCSVWNEGALGCVVQVRNSEMKNTRFALKIPRLLADTIRENAYINDVMTTELLTIKEFYNKMKADHVPGLLPAQIPFLNPLQYATNTSSGENEAAAQDGNHVWIRLEKGRGPRFCSIGKHDGRVRVFPDGIEGPTRELLIKRFEDLQQQERDRKTHVIATASKEKDTSNVYPIDDSLHRNNSIDAWFATPPSVLYSWADGSLQAAATCGRLQKWRTPQIVHIGKCILTGIRALHSAGLLHADIRPANVMCVGKEDDPSAYVVIDYSSFGGNGLMFGSPGAADDDQKTLGPAAMPQRASPFYAPERRSGAENEAADTAIVTRFTANDAPAAKGDVPAAKAKNSKDLGSQPQAAEHARSGFVIRLGWSKDLLDDEHTPRPEVVQRLRQAHSLPTFGSSDPERLQRGDRLRLRDFVFEVDGTLDEDGTLIRCTDRLWQVYHDRLVASISPKDCPTVIHVPRIVEIRHASASTDVYGIGSVLLYVAVCAGRTVDSAKPDKEGQATAAAQDRRFSELMRCIESTQYFQAVWPRICRCVAMIEDNLRKNPAQVLVSDNPRETASRTTLLDACKSTAMLLLSTAPAMSRVYTACNTNLAEFLLLLHFVLGCVQRRSSLVSDNGPVPFCRNRLDAPQPTSPVEPAFARMKRIDEILGLQILGDYSMPLTGEQSEPGDDKVKELGADDPIYRIELQEVRAELGKVKQEIRRLEGELARANAARKAATEAMESSDRQLETRAVEAKQRLDDLKNQLAEARGREKKLREDAEEYTRRLAELRSTVDSVVDDMNEKCAGMNPLVRKSILAGMAKRLKPNAHSSSAASP
jgi:serine/threonine protein kinase